MSTLTCAEVEMELPALALDALNSDERANVLAHLDLCENCQQKLSEYKEVTFALLESVPQRTPPPILKTGLMKAIRPARKPILDRLGNWFGHEQVFPRWALASAFMLLLIAIGLLGYETSHLAGQQAAMASQLAQQQQALALLSGNSTNLINMAGTQAAADASAVMRYDPTENLAVVQTQNLPTLPEGKTYQLWLIDASGKRDSGGIFNTSAGGKATLLVVAPRPMNSYVGCGVSIEPSGGSRAPTGPAALKGNLWS